MEKGHNGLQIQISVTDLGSSAIVLTPRRVLPEKPVILQWVKKFSLFYGTPSTMFTRARQ
jgi:hypothetical protein